MLDVGEFVRGLRDEPRGAFLSLRAVALGLGPDVVERVEESSVTYLRRDTPFLVVEAIRARLIATFPPETAIDDPMGRLLKRGDQRYFRLDVASELDAHTQEFVRKAYTVARTQ